MMTHSHLILLTRDVMGVCLLRSRILVGQPHGSCRAQVVYFSGSPFKIYGALYEQVRKTLYLCKAIHY